MHALNGVRQGRPILLFEDVLPHLDHVVRPQSDEQAVECTVVQGAKGDPVSDCWLSFRV